MATATAAAPTSYGSTTPPDLWTKYKALWIVLILIVLAGAIAGSVILVLHYVVHKGSRTARPSVSIAACSGGQVSCNNKCCNQAQTVNGQCVCADACASHIVCQVNATSVCCPSTHPICGLNEGECCVTADATDCVQGTVNS